MTWIAYRWARLLTASTMIMGAVGAGCIGGAPRAFADGAIKSDTAPLAFCSDLLTFDSKWSPVNLDFPGQPFFSDGNNDGIADLLEIGRPRIPSVAADLAALAAEAPSDVQGSLRTMAADLRELATEPAPATAADSRRQTAAIEQTAAGVQRDLKGEGCLGRVGAAQSEADSSASAAGSGASGSGSQLHPAALAVFVLLCCPLVVRVWRNRRRPTLNREGSRFTGNLRRWKVQTLTGNVLGVNERSVTSASAGGLVGAGGHVSVVTRTTTYETIRLRFTDGTQDNVELVNLVTSPSIGDVVTACVGRTRLRVETFAVLNHTTGRSRVDPQKLFSLRSGGAFRQSLFVLGLCFTIPVLAILVVFSGAWWMLAIWCALLGVFALESRRQASIDLQPLWLRARHELERLRA